MNIVREDRQRLLDEIIEWATAVAMQGTIEELKRIIDVQVDDDSLLYIFTKITELVNSFRVLHARVPYIRSICSALAEEDLMKAVQTVNMCIEGSIRWLGDWRRTIPSKYTDFDKHRYDTSGNLTVRECQVLNDLIIELLNEAYRVKSKELG